MTDFFSHPLVVSSVPALSGLVVGGLISLVSTYFAIKSLQKLYVRNSEAKLVIKTLISLGEITSGSVDESKEAYVFGRFEMCRELLTDHVGANDTLMAEFNHYHTIVLHGMKDEDVSEKKGQVLAKVIKLINQKK